MHMSTSAPAAKAVTPRVNVYKVHVEFGDCDPARIVWFPNFFRWCDAASRHFFTHCGIPLWHELEKTRSIIGTPLVDIHARFVMTASNDDVLEVHTSIIEWRQKSFVQRHRILRAKASGEPDLIMECDEVRIFAARREGSSTAIRALPIPADIRAQCQ